MAISTATMRHWYLTGRREATPIDEAMPLAGAGEVLVRIAWTAISPGSNVHVWKTGSYRGDAWIENEDLLYQGSGVVESVGQGVASVASGDRVVMSTGHQELVVAPEAAVHRVPDGLSLRDAAVSYLPSWSVSVLHLGRYEAAETVVVIGQGLVGASAALIAELNGARVLALDLDPRRVALARGLGIGHAARPIDEAEIAEYLGSRGPDLIIETTGHWGGLRQAIALARDFTRIAVMGIYRQPPPPDLGLDLFGSLFSFPAKFNYKRLEIIGCGGDPATITPPARRHATTGSNWDYVLEQAARGRLPLGRLVTHVLQPSEIADALERLASGDTSMLGVVFDWGVEPDLG